MEINANNQISSQVQGVESTPKVNEVKQEEEKANNQQAAQAEENPDYRVSLSEMSKQQVADLSDPMAAGQKEAESGITEQEAADLAQQTSAQLSQTNMAIANQAMQKALDLFP